MLVRKFVWPLERKCADKVQAQLVNVCILHVQNLDQLGLIISFT